ncbi:MAG: SRPBCC family protein [Phycisphaeraceae bacterium]
MPTTLRAESTPHFETPPETVFDVIDTPDRYFEMSPSLKENRGVEPKPGGGHDVGYVFEMNGQSLTGTVRVQEHERPRHLIWRMEGDLTGRIEWDLNPTDDGCDVTYRVEYQPPDAVLNNADREQIVAYNQDEVEQTLDNLRARVER